jgi:flagellar motility protein MotE (MotC chaperone)
MPMPRLLPLVAIAAGGVLAINAVENGPGIVGAARSFAEGVAAKHAKPDAKGGDAAQAAATNTTAVDANAQVVAAKPAPICAESPAQLAKDAGLSPAELQVIQSLGARRGELDQREQGLSTQLALIQAAEAKVDAKIATMNQMKAEMTGMLGQLDDKQQAEVDRLVKVFETMIQAKPQDAADRFVLLSDEVRLPIAAKMKERLLSQMIAKMPPPEAKRLTEALAARYAAQANAARAAMNAQAAPAKAAAATPAPTQTAQAATPAADATAVAPPATTPKPAKPAVHRKPKPKPAALAAATPAATTASAAPAKPTASGAAASPAKPAAAGAAAASPATATPAKSASAPPAPPKPASASAPAPTKSAASAPAAPAPAPAKSG